MKHEATAELQHFPSPSTGPKSVSEPPFHVKNERRSQLGAFVVYGIELQHKAKNCSARGGVCPITLLLYGYRVGINISKQKMLFKRNSPEC
ncbi:hypothetical protein PF010_g6043 [Phytophthora fragariae]|uniref:Uncharacterized protein n=1 Tax=Phytophthora fragariae TaxID=53985 RepID=A0A6A4BBU9_9STRA|nr:hypothetical protein PF010_g6043 [Phytophthora fragariae]KAE9270283.1 hypothetical protein PF001_g28860 [Phytophthora fragariae]